MTFFIFNISTLVAFQHYEKTKKQLRASLGGIDVSSLHVTGLVAMVTGR